MNHSQDETALNSEQHGSRQHAYAGHHKKFPIGIFSDAR